MGGVFSIRSWDIDMDELTNTNTPAAPTSPSVPPTGGRRNNKRKTRKRRQVKS